MHEKVHLWHQVTWMLLWFDTAKSELPHNYLWTPPTSNAKICLNNLSTDKVRDTKGRQIQSSTSARTPNIEVSFNYILFDPTNCINSNE